MKSNIFITIKFSLIITFSVLMLSGCDDFLDREPISQPTEEAYFQNADQLAAYVINYYKSYSQWDANSTTTGGQIPSPTSFGGYSPYHDDRATDNEVTRTSRNSFLLTSAAPRVEDDEGGYWNFENINALNYYLERVVPLMEEGKIVGSDYLVKHYVGEGYFLRALEYFFRLKKLGDFPIITVSLPDQKPALVEASKRQPRNEVARFILSDLDKAIELLSNEPPGGRNRITKDVAYLLKARIALYEGTFEKYHKGTARVPLGQGWPGLAKNPNYTFPNGTIDEEIKFFLEEALEASKIVADAHPNLAQNSKQDKGLASKPANDYYDMFAVIDPSPYDEVLMYRSYALGELGIANSMLASLYSSSEFGYTMEFEKAFLMENGLPWYANGSEYAGDTLVQNTKIARDWRWRLFMKAPNEFLFSNGTEQLPGAPQIHNVAKYRSSTGYMKSKAYSEDVTMNVAGKDITAYVIYRAAEAYLIYIEAAYELYGMGLNSDAWNYWKKLRNRAGVDEDIQKTIVATNMTIEGQYDWAAYSGGQLVDATLYNIRRERRCELISEGFRFDDLIRWCALDQLNNTFLHGCRVFDDEGKVLSVFPSNGVNLSFSTNGSFGARYTASSPVYGSYLSPFQIIENEYNAGLNFKKSHYLEPIHYRHFLYSSPDNMSPDASPIYQNPGWPVEPNGFGEN